MRNGHIQSAKTELERFQKQGNTAANRNAPKQPADQGNKSSDTPLSGKEKGDTEKRCRRNESSKDFVRAVLKNIDKFLNPTHPNWQFASSNPHPYI